MASLDDILTTHKNVVVALNSLGKIAQAYTGTVTSLTVAASTVIIVGSGRLVNFSITVVGTTNGFIHNTTTVALATAANALCAVPMPSATADHPYPGIGVFPVNAVFDKGLVIVPGTGQKLNVTYSLT